MDEIAYRDCAIEGQDTFALHRQSYDHSWSVIPRVFRAREISGELAEVCSTVIGHVAGRKRRKSGPVDWREYTVDDTYQGGIVKVTSPQGSRVNGCGSCQVFVGWAAGSGFGAGLVSASSLYEKCAA